MNPIKRLYQKLPFKIVNRHNAPSRGMQYMGGGRNSLFSFMHSDAYSSAYPSIRAISNEYMTVRPYAIDKNGNRIKENDIINALYHPNQADSSVSFFEKIAVSTLSLRKTYILVWRLEGREAKPGGDFTQRSNKIAGFTFLEFPSVTRRDNKTYYNIGSQEFSEKEVIVLPGGVNPYDLYGGYSPSEASRRWAKLDDYIADFQAGFFENGAVPAGQFMITAASNKEYNDIVDMLEARHRGAGKNGNVTYAHRPIDPESGKPADAQIEWIPYAQKNKDIDFKNLFDQTNKRIETAFGVPAIVKGIDDAATYANAQIAERGFSKRAVYPLLLRNYTQITHELNRITNGMGVAITFDYQIPSVADEDYVNAQRKEVESQIIRDMSTAGYSLDSIVDAFDLSDEYKKLAQGSKKTSSDEDQTDVDEGNEVSSAPDPDKIDGVTPINKGGSKRKNPKAELSDEDKIYNIAKKFMQSQIDRAVSELEQSADNAADPTEDEKQDFVDDTLVVIVSIMVTQGVIEYAAGKELLEAAGKSIENLDEFILSDTAKDAYQAYLKKVGESYGSDTAKAIRAVLANAEDNGLTVKETENALKNILNTDEYRIKRIAVTEVGRSMSLSGVEAMKQIQAESGVELEKSLFHKNGPECEFCKALEGQWIKVDAALVNVDETLVGVDGGELPNNFATNEGYDPHPNGKGSMIFRVVS